MSVDVGKRGSCAAACCAQSFDTSARSFVKRAWRDRQGCALSTHLEPNGRFEQQRHHSTGFRYRVRVALAFAHGKGTLAQTTTGDA